MHKSDNLSLTMLLHICDNTFVRVEVRYYIAKSGKAPFIEWLEKLKDRVARAKIKVKIDRLMRGLFGDTKSVGQGIEELRIHYGPGYRVYYGRIRNTVILLLCGGTKGGQRRDIERAKRYWSDYLEACHGKKKKKDER